MKQGTSFINADFYYIIMAKIMPDINRDFEHSKCKCKEIEREFTTIIIKRLRQAKANFFIDAIKEARGNGKTTWQTINKLIGRKQNHNNNDLELKINTISYRSNHHIYRTKHLFRLCL